jgi:EmrB/QacA subfamily drug resistance transporter
MGAAGSTRSPSLGWTLGLTSFAYFMVALDSLVVVTALPAIDRELHASLSTLQWTINAYGLTWAAGIITAAALGDLLGRKRVFTAGVALFTLSSAVCAIAPNIGVLIAARAVQGVGAAFILPLSLTILAGVFPAEKRGTIVGIWGGIGGLAIAAGPLVGGSLTQSLGWHWVFWLNVPIGVVVLAFTLFKIVESHGPGTRLDLVGVVLVTLGAAALVWGLVRSSDAGWGSGQVIGSLVAGVVLIVAFLLWERRAPQPMLPLRLFRIRTFSAANVTGFLMTAALLSAGVYVSQYFQFGRGASPFGAGLRLVPMMVMPLLIAPLAGMIADKIGPKVLIVGGLVIEAIGVGWFALAGNGSIGYGALVVPLVLGGAGIALSQATTPTAALSSVPREDMGRASGTQTTLQRFGGAFGVAIATAAFSASGGLASPAKVISGSHAALLVSAGMALLGAIAALAIQTPKRSATPPAPKRATAPAAADR